MKLKNLTAIFLFTFIVIPFSGCKKDDNNNGTPTSGSIFGKVVNENNTPIQGAIVSAGNISATTDGFGRFELQNPPAVNNVVTIKATAPDCFPGYINVSKSTDAADYTIIKLINYDGTQTAIGTTSTGGNASFGTFSINVGNGGFTDESGNPYTGSVTVRARYIAADDQEIDELMPGRNFDAVDTTGANGIMETMGFVAVDFTDNNGNIIIPNPGNAQVTIQITPEVAATLSGASSWAFNNTSGQWNYSGQITAGSSQVTMEFVSRFVNCDVFVRPCTITGRVVDCNNQPVKNKKVTLTSNLLRYSAYTNSNGFYSVSVSSRPSSYTIDCEGKTTVVTGIAPTAQIAAADIQLPVAFYSETYSDFSATTGYMGGCQYSYSNVLAEAQIACQPGSASTMTFTGSWKQQGDSCWNWMQGFSVEIPLSVSGGIYSGSIVSSGVTFTISNGQLNSANKTFSANANAGYSSFDAPINRNIVLKGE